MKITWLGQAGLLFDTGHLTVLIDPYFSDSVAKLDPQKKRRMEIEPRFWELSPDVLIFTHDHLDHYDPETASVFLQRSDKCMTVLCPTSVWQKARTYGNGHNYVEMNSGTEWTQGGLRFCAVPAAHSDPYAIGILLEDLTDHKRYYVTGDTLYSQRIFPSLPQPIHMVLLPINGVGNNMNATDAARFCHQIGAQLAVPLHWGLFDSLDPSAFEFPHKIIPQICKEIEVVK